ncbi:uncharacterized protein [Coffea arabica]|uniref:Zinc finger PMZ-type domain-containing protein n=1 Tax=Coffea arabica TaxID=13443 RepID=A0ABM4UF56_COFAR
MTNNFTESFNAWVSDLRRLPILTLYEGVVPPKIVEKLREIATQSRKCELSMTSETLFEVKEFGKSYIANLQKRTCEYGAFHILGIPCKHGALGIIYRRENLKKYCDPMFTIEVYQKTYFGMINPVSDERNWSNMLEVRQRREKPGRGLANTGLTEADHVSGNVPVVFSSQGSNPNCPNQST